MPGARGGGLYNTKYSKLSLPLAMHYQWLGSARSHKHLPFLPYNGGQRASVMQTARMGTMWRRIEGTWAMSALDVHLKA